MGCIVSSAAALNRDMVGVAIVPRSVAKRVKLNGDAAWNARASVVTCDCVLVSVAECAAVPGKTNGVQAGILDDKSDAVTGYIGVVCNFKCERGCESVLHRLSDVKPRRPGLTTGVVGGEPQRCTAVRRAAVRADEIRARREVSEIRALRPRRRASRNQQQSRDGSHNNESGSSYFHTFPLITYLLVCPASSGFTMNLDRATDESQASQRTLPIAGQIVDNNSG